MRERNESAADVAAVVGHQHCRRLSRAALHADNVIGRLGEALGLQPRPRPSARIGAVRLFRDNPLQAHSLDLFEEPRPIANDLVAELDLAVRRLDQGPKLLAALDQRALAQGTQVPKQQPQTPAGLALRGLLS